MIHAFDFRSLKNNFLAPIFVVQRRWVCVLVAALFAVQGTELWADDDSIPELVDDGSQQVVNADTSNADRRYSEAQDFVVPSGDGIAAVTFELRGGDGGRARQERGRDQEAARRRRLRLGKLCRSRLWMVEHRLGGD